MELCSSNDYTKLHLALEVVSYKIRMIQCKLKQHCLIYLNTKNNEEGNQASYVYTLISQNHITNYYLIKKKLKAWSLMLIEDNIPLENNNVHPQ